MYFVVFEVLCGYGFEGADTYMQCDVCEMKALLLQ